MPANITALHRTRAAVSRSLIVAAALVFGAITVSEAEDALSFTPGVTMANYTRLKTGMTYAQVVKILGKEGTELSSNEIIGIKTVMYEWRGDGLAANIFSGGNMNVMFQSGKLIQKAQFGLR